MSDVELLPCPFCGSGKTEIREDRHWLGMRYGEPASVSVRHKDFLYLVKRCNEDGTPYVGG